jgi:hypothetical protein
MGFHSFTREKLLIKHLKKGGNMKRISTILCFLLVLSVGMFAQSAVGTWNYYYDWGCNGGYGSSTITIKSDGTFSCGVYNGKWYQVQGQIIWVFSVSNATTYSGTIVGGAMLGMMENNTGQTGCWYCTKQDYKALKMEEPLDVNGKKLKKKK